MSSTRSDDVLRIVRDFVARIDQLDPEAAEVGELTLSWRDTTERVTIRRPVVRALTEALLAYHDPRDHGACEHCAGGRLDENFMCRSCGIVNGVFGQTLTQFVSRDDQP
jgi:hypothetical protein